MPLIVSGLALLGSFALPSIIPPLHDTKVESTYEEPNFVLLNPAGGIVYEQRGYPAVGSNLFVDANTLDDPIMRSRLELTALLDLENKYVGIGFLKITAFEAAKRMELRDSPVIVAQDYTADFERMSKAFEGENYPPEYTSELVRMIRDGAEQSYLPGAQLVIESDSAAVKITSFDPEGNLMSDPKRLPYTDTKSVTAYGQWLSRRIDEPFEEIQDSNLGDSVTPRTYLNSARPDTSTIAAK